MKKSVLIFLPFTLMLLSCGQVDSKPEMATSILQPGYTYTVSCTTRMSISRMGPPYTRQFKVAVDSCDNGRSSYFHTDGGYYQRISEVSNANWGCAEILHRLGCKSSYDRNNGYDAQIHTVEITSIEVGNKLRPIQEAKIAEEKERQQAEEQAEANKKRQKRAAAEAKGCSGLYVGKVVTFPGKIWGTMDWVITGVDAASGQATVKSQTDGQTYNGSCVRVHELDQRE